MDNSVIRCSGCIINTCGWIENEGLEFQARSLGMFGCNVVIVVDDDNLRCCILFCVIIIFFNHYHYCYCLEFVWSSMLKR
jgi:polynucleotide 5'-kinase involved in rRNA processing